MNTKLIGSLEVTSLSFRMKLVWRDSKESHPGTGGSIIPPAHAWERQLLPFFILKFPPNFHVIQMSKLRYRLLPKIFPNKIK